MKKSFKLFLVLLLVFIIVDRLISFGLGSMANKVVTGQGVGKVNQFLKIKDSVNLLVFGSSRANHHVENQMLDTASFNMGVDGTKLGQSAGLISTLNKKNQIILVHIDQSTVFDEAYQASDILNLINITSDYKSVKSLIFDFFPEEIYVTNAINSYAYNGKVLSIFKNYFMPDGGYMKHRGYDPLVPSEAQKEIFEALIKNNDFVKDKRSKFEINGAVDILVGFIKNKGEELNSRVIFFTSPSLRPISGQMRSATENYFKSKEAEYYDYSDFDDGSNKSYWKDFTHMSAKGARAFTKEIEVLIKRK
ncbi:hypothetical protein H7U19_11215 [Hyunsoonleella sp. SJ7]|uniref:SGNH/GDSL hydrolase family protein n=1 Tax=Hyunsoonleella aquatilis TaxID=2762758 RepID=A0A923KLM2_9FLAO|nr:hypothetical protein [Hyunsoonleella aquatilis]MBC3758978.1 hypothetical protein [Hyunsoonleella aquatilis]